MRKLLFGIALLLAAGSAGAQSLSASPSTVYAGQPVNAAWSGIASPTSADWIGLYVAGAADNAFVAYIYTDGSASGSAPLTVPANTAAGSYELRFFRNNTYTKIATSNGFSIQTPSGSISASPALVYSGQPVTTTWSAISSPTATDWVGLYAAGAADTAFVAYIYTDGNASGSAPLTVPANTAAGSYELRLFSANGYQRLGTSAGFSVQTPSGSISASPSIVYLGQSVTAAWSAISLPTATDWVGLYYTGDPDNAFVAYIYTDGNASGSAPFLIPSSTSADTYELRLFSNNGYQLLGTSNIIDVQAPPPATLSVSPGNVPAGGGSVTAAWTNIVAPSATDWIGLYLPNAADTAFISWRYTTGTGSGDVPFDIAASVANGTYQLRLFSNNGYTRLATSANFTVGFVPLALHYIHADHLNSPRRIYDASQQLVWAWDQQEPFGDSPANENPSGLGTFDFPIRMEGLTYLDRETNLLYNTNRYRDTSIGRFPQADPLGLHGGELSLYVLTKNNPLSFTDPLGLFTPGRHNEITRRAAASSCPAAAGGLAYSVMQADFTPGSQLPANAPQHGMSAPGQSAAQAAQATQQFIEDQLKSCSLQGLARALHAAQDQYAGGHRGGQTWPGGLPSFGHVMQDAFPGQAAGAAEAASRALIQQFKAMCPCSPCR